jgi:6-phosphogluconolactonase
MPEIEILPDADSLASRAAEVFVRLGAEALKTRDTFRAVLAGGSTPERTYALLAGAKLEWRNVHIFWGDERCVPPSRPESNYRKAAQILLDRIAIPPDNVHRIRGELPADEAARDYELELRRVFRDELPRFDLVLLGLGTDGHTASLFPGTPAIHEKNRWTAAVIHGTPPPPLVDRVTLTLPVLNAAANVIFLVAGADKAEILSRILQNPPHSDLLPAHAIKPVNGSLRWLVDRSAAARLSESQPQWKTDKECT